MRIVILADSLARARPDLPESDRTRYQDVYGYLLKQRYWCRHEVELLYVESLDSEDAVHWSQRMVAFREPDVVIYHFGINDCAPRVFRKGSHSILLRPWFIKATRNMGLRLVHRFRGPLTRLRQLVYVPLPVFERNLRKMMEEVCIYSPNAHFYAVSIGEVPEEMAARSYRYNENVRAYNEVLARVFGDSLVDINQLLPRAQRLISDGVHLTKQGHTALALELAARIEREIPSLAERGATT